MLQASMLDGLAFDAVTVGQDGFGAAEVGVRRGHVVEALVIAAMVVVNRAGFAGDLLS